MLKYGFQNTLTWCVNIYIYINAVKLIIVINRIQNKLFTKCMCTIYIYYVYINTHIYSIYLENIYMYIHFYSYILYYLNI